MQTFNRSLSYGKMIQLYLCEPENSTITLSSGVKLKYREWLEREKERILQDPDRQAEIRPNDKKQNFIGLWVNDVGIVDTQWSPKISE
jgi:hypothetical protein